MNIKDRIIRARIRLQSKQPFFSYLSLFLKFREAKKGELPTYAGAGVNIEGDLLYNKEWFEKLTDNLLLSVISHETCHLAFLHLNRLGSRDKVAWNFSCDLVINTLLKKNGFELKTCFNNIIRFH